MSKYICLTVAALLVFIAGCDEEKYSIEMEPRGAQIERKFTFSGQLSEQEREQLSATYEQQLDPNTFIGTFTENLPNDIGGAGFYVASTSTMGDTFFYWERFKGDDDLNYNVEQMQLLGDRLADLATGWFGRELGNHPNFIKLKEFCEHDLRQDVKNVLIYIWLSEISSRYEGPGSEEMKLRIKNYLVERGYFAPAEFDIFIQRFQTDSESVLPIVRRVIARELSYPSPGLVADWLAFLSDDEHAKLSLTQYICSTELFRDAWEAKKLEEGNPYAEPPEPLDLIARDVNLPIFHFNPGSRLIEVTLASGCKPFSTNGKWDDESSCVVWSSPLAEDNDLPTFFYASWGEPNELFQREHFGCLLFIDERLSEYCLWKNGLDEDRAKEWDAFIMSISPNDNLEKRISEFRFRPDTCSEAAPADPAQRGRELILTALRTITQRADVK
jgi:hypothetical protein